MIDFLRVENIVWIFRGLNDNHDFRIHSNWKHEIDMDKYNLVVGWYVPIMSLYLWTLYLSVLVLQNFLDT